MIPNAKPNNPETKESVGKTVTQSPPVKGETKERDIPELVKAIKGVVSEEIAVQIVDALELEARRRAGVHCVGCIVFDQPYGEFRKMKLAEPSPTQEQQDENSD